MLDFIEGIVINKSEKPSFCVLNVNGLGLSALIAKSTYQKIQLQEKILLYTELSYNAEKITLYGFYTIVERELFRLISGIKGIGGKTALAVLDGVSFLELYQIVNQDKVNVLSEKVSGVGKKTAERIIFELKRQIEQLLVLATHADLSSADLDSPSVDISQSEEIEEVKDILKTLGYKADEIKKAVSSAVKKLDLDKSVISTDEILKISLSLLAGH